MVVNKIKGFTDSLRGKTNEKREKPLGLKHAGINYTSAFKEGGDDTSKCSLEENRDKLKAQLKKLQEQAKATAGQLDDMNAIFDPLEPLKVARDKVKELLRVNLSATVELSPIERNDLNAKLQEIESVISAIEMRTDLTDFMAATEAIRSAKNSTEDNELSSLQEKQAAARKAIEDMISSVLDGQEDNAGQLDKQEAAA